MIDPRNLYEARLSERRVRHATLEQRGRWLSFARLGMILLALIVAWLSFGPLVLLPVAGFVALVIIHDRVVRERNRLASAMRFFARGIERIEKGPTGTGTTGEEFVPDQHPYARDLDLFGKRSLYELMCVAATGTGRRTLAGWLLGPSTNDTIRSRQGAVSELRDRVDLREELAILASDQSAGMDESRLAAWSREPAVLHGSTPRIAALVLASASLISLVLAVPVLVAKTSQGAFVNPVWGTTIPLVAVVVLGGAFARFFKSRVGEVIAGVERAEPALALLAVTLQRLEHEEFSSPELLRLREAWRQDGEPASRRIARLRRLVTLLDSRRNQFFAPLGALMLWTTNLAFAIERWRQDSGVSVGRWIEAVGELEAMSSLATFAFEHPSFVAPELVDSGVFFEGLEAGHPLIPTERRVCNDFAFSSEGTRLLLISGSNMSGKSTMLRAMGINAVLAMAGAPVCARSLKITPLSIGASIQINDSLQEGASHFYAEILRIRQIVGMAGGERPLLFLLDEVLHGTNSHDRRIGAEAIVRGLVSRGAIGAVSTHDLALAAIAETVAGAKNVHFEDQIEDGEMRFDYRMQPGVVKRSNALELMRSIGIEV